MRPRGRGASGQGAVPGSIRWREALPDPSRQQGLVMDQTARVERIEPYLRPDQVSALVDEKRAIEATMTAPPYISNQIQDRSAMLKHARNLDKMLDEGVPKPYAEADLDRAFRREEFLREEITHGMLTQAEMRRNPYGA